MAQCASFIAVPIDGSSVSVLAQSTDSPCTTAVVLTPAEYGALSSNPFNLSMVDGALVSAAVVGVWGIGWAFRALTRTLDNGGDSTE